jgi:tRNA(Ile)-lysidine synthase
VTRAETFAYCAARGLTPREDATNRDLAFARNRVRHRLLPALEAEAPPGFRRRLLALAAEVEEEVAVLEAAALSLLDRATRRRDADALLLDAAVLTEAAPALARRALRRAVRLLESECELDRAVTETLLRLAMGDLTTGVTLPGGRVRAARRGDEFSLRVSPARPAAEATEPAVPLPVPGSAILGDWRVSACPTAPPAAPAGDPGSWVLLDADRVHGGLSVRFPRPGDRVRPLGMKGRRKLQDLFVDRKLPRPERGRVPVVVDEEKILWVVGFCMSEDARLGAATSRALRLEARRQDLNAAVG